MPRVIPNYEPEQVLGPYRVIHRNDSGRSMSRRYTVKTLCCGRVTNVSHSGLTRAHNRAFDECNPCRKAKRQNRNRQKVMDEYKKPFGFNDPFDHQVYCGKWK